MSANCWQARCAAHHSTEASGGWKDIALGKEDDLGELRLLCPPCGVTITRRRCVAAFARYVEPYF